MRGSPRSGLRATILSLAVALAVSAPASALHAQGGAAGNQQEAGPWPPASAGLRFGYDQSANGEVLGAQLRIPVLRNGHLEVVPGADVTFVTRLREYGFTADLVYVSGGRQGGFYGGGGIALRNSVYGTDPESARETKTGFGAVIGLKTGGPAGLGTQVEFRWVFLPGVEFDPRAVTVGVNIPLWGRRNGS
ncbi:MAG: hypothetical protein U5R14_02950 [Gemmatimonadota bacterium]|nr:hypothetical protein [Gemmatimonadota bacterium]